MWTSASVVLAGRALAFPLLQLIVESTLLLALAHFAATALRRRSAAERNAVWLATFAGLAALPLLLPIPAFWKLSLNHWPATNHTVAHFRLVHVVSAVDSSFAVRTGLLAVWLGGILLLWLRSGVRIFRLSRLDRRAAHFPLAIEAARTQVKVASRARPLLLSTAEADVPFTWGALRPRIILPASASVWSKRRFGAVLAHELAHVARSDWLTQVFAELTTAVYWFHPLAWHALAQLKREQEQACDDRVLAGGVDACVYAAELLALARAARWRDFWAPVPADFARSYLEERMKSILNRCTSRRKSSPVAIAIISVGAIAATLALTTVRVQAVGTLPKAAEAPAQSTKTQIQPDAKTEKTSSHPPA